jgi:hypothetical protein
MMVYDSAHGQIVLFGGMDGNFNPLNDTWVWDGTNWTQKAPQTNPPARGGQAMAYDSAHGQVVMFGGQVGLLNDTWIWDGANWTQKSPATVPPPGGIGNFGFFIAMAYDAASSQTVLYGNDIPTWLWDGTNWTPKTTQLGPQPGPMVYDSLRNQIVMVGTPLTGLLDQTSTWNGTSWGDQIPANKSHARDW